MFYLYKHHHYGVYKRVWQLIDIPGFHFYEHALEALNSHMAQIGDNSTWNWRVVWVNEEYKPDEFVASVYFSKKDKSAFMHNGL